jgi:hypothetical protein
MVGSLTASCTPPPEPAPMPDHQSARSSCGFIVFTLPVSGLTGQHVILLSRMSRKGGG